MEVRTKKFSFNFSSWGFNPKSSDKLEWYFFLSPEGNSYYYAYRLDPEYLKTQGIRGRILRLRTKWTIPRIKFDYPAWLNFPHIPPHEFLMPFEVKNIDDAQELIKKFKTFGDLAAYQHNPYSSQSILPSDTLFQKCVASWNKKYGSYNYVRI